MMPVQSFSSFKRMTAFCRTHVPDKIWNDLNPIADDDSIVKAYGVKLCVEMCTELFSTGTTG
jgi:methylenetetrahydrofolate reductase (NADPH)